MAYLSLQHDTLFLGEDYREWAFSWNNRTILRMPSLPEFDRPKPLLIRHRIYEIEYEASWASCAAPICAICDGPRRSCARIPPRCRQGRCCGQLRCNEFSAPSQNVLPAVRTLPPKESLNFPGRLRRD